jgi:hypothetical protein
MQKLDNQPEAPLIPVGEIHKENRAHRILVQVLSRRNSKFLPQVLVVGYYASHIGRFVDGNRRVFAGLSFE